MALSDKVRQRRMELGWSQEELASRMGYKSRTSINKIENGRPVTQKIIARLSQVLDVPLSSLMGWEEEMEVRPAEMAERHFEIIMDEDISDIFDDFRSLNPAQKKIVKDLVHSLAQTKTEA